jgi:predicted nucleotidyltransferase
VRLSEFEIKTIKNAITALDANAQIYIFGSRANDALKGGDIDILVLSEILTFNDKLSIKKALFKDLEEQKIDMIITKDPTDPFVQLAIESGVELQ